MGLRWDEDRGGVSVVCIAISMSTASGACQRGEPPRSPKAQRARSPAHSCALQSPGDPIGTGPEGGDVIRDRYIVNFRPAISKQTMEDVKDNIGTLPDFGNVTPDIRYEAMEKLAPYAAAVHAKTHEFGEDGEDVNIDIGRCVRIMKDAGYDGPFGIEFEGSGSDHEGVLKTKALLERYL